MSETNERGAWLRVITPGDTESLSHDEGQDLFKVEWKAARAAYVDALVAFGGWWVRELLQTAKPLTPGKVRAIRDDAHVVADKTREVAARLDAAVAAVERVRGGV
jgi:hypothetical protein